MPSFIGRAKRYHIVDKEALAKGPPPDVSAPLSWFTYTDKGQDGTISPEEVASTLCMQLGPESSQERIYIHNATLKEWSNFDKNNDMVVSKNEFLQCGMIQFIVNFQKKWNEECDRRCAFVKTTKRHCKGRPPFLTEAQKWFEYVDTSNDQELSADEVIHGLILTLKPSTSQEKVTIRDIVEYSFILFDDNGNGTIEKSEFLSKDGMSEALIRISDQWGKLSIDERTMENMSKVIGPPLRYTAICPPPLSHAAAWFDHYDINGDNVLTLKEIVHALYVSYNTVTLDRQNVIRELVSSTWKIFDKDNNKNISRDEFLHSSKGMAVMYDTFFKKMWPNYSIKIEQQLQPQLRASSLSFDESKTIDVKINIPKCQSVGDLVKIPSPRTKKPVLLIIPGIKKWKREKSGAYFVVKF